MTPRPCYRETRVQSSTLKWRHPDKRLRRSKSPIEGGMPKCSAFSYDFAAFVVVQKLKVLDYPDEYSLTGEHIATQQSYRFLMCTKYGPIADIPTPLQF